MDIQQPPAKLPPDAPEIAAIAPADVAQWRKRWTRFLFGAALPADRPPLNIKEDRREGRDGIERLHLTYETEPGVRTEAYLLRPKNIEGKLPGVVVFHSTSKETIEQTGSFDPSVDRHIGIHLARRGYVVLCPRNFIFGSKSYKDEVAKMQQRHPTWKGMARMVWDGWRAVDILAARKDVDSARLGCIGHSLGAKEALFSAAFDERLKAAVSSDGGIGLKLSNWDAIWYLGEEVRSPSFELENHQVLAMIAPHAFLLVGGDYDNDRAWPFIRSAVPLWRALSAPEAIGWFRHTAGHNWPPEAQKVGYEFLDRWLANNRN